MIPRVTVHRPLQDYGPATKLLGALDYLRTTDRKFDHVITFDDDCYYNDPRAVIEYLERGAAQKPGAVITLGGIRLDRPPYRNKNGLFHNCSGYVDIVCGWRGVLYPVDALMRDTRVFDLQADMPPGVAHDDDAYFGICMSRMDIPVYALKDLRHTNDGTRLHVTSCEGGGGSAVQERVAKDRVDNEMEIVQHAVAHGWLPSRMAAREKQSAIVTMMRRNRVLRKFVKAMDF